MGHYRHPNSKIVYNTFQQIFLFPFFSSSFKRFSQAMVFLPYMPALLPKTYFLKACFAQNPAPNHVRCGYPKKVEINFILFATVCTWNCSFKSSKCLVNTFLERARFPKNAILGLTLCFQSKILNQISTNRNVFFFKR